MQEGGVFGERVVCHTVVQSHINVHDVSLLEDVRVGDSVADHFVQAVHDLGNFFFTYLSTVFHTTLWGFFSPPKITFLSPYTPGANRLRESIVVERRWVRITGKARVVDYLIDLVSGHSRLDRLAREVKHFTGKTADLAETHLIFTTDAEGLAFVPLLAEGDTVWVVSVVRAGNACRHLAHWSDLSWAELALEVEHHQVLRRHGRDACLRCLQVVLLMRLPACLEAALLAEVRGREAKFAAFGALHSGFRLLTSCAKFCRHF